MAFSTAGGRPFQAEINMTPMIDVLLVLIIVFMVVVSMSQEKGLHAEIPQPANSKQSHAGAADHRDSAWLDGGGSGAVGEGQRSRA